MSQDATNILVHSCEPLPLTEQQFLQISDLVKGLCGINLHDGKKELVKARLGKRLRQLDLRSFSDYLEYVRKDASGQERMGMLDALSTNLTSFFREADHFDYLGQKLLKQWTARPSRRIRIWSAGCSTGEEPYSIAMRLKEELPDLSGRDVAILATDLSHRVLSVARQGVYAHTRLRGMPGQCLSQNFEMVQARPDRIYQVRDGLRKLVTFAHLNLMEPWPMQGPFDAIFCRNVMIYFDKPTQSRLVERFWQLLGIGGVLFIGHSESLAGVQHKFQYLQPTVYAKVQ